MDNKKNKVYKVVMLVIITTIITFMITSIGMYNYFTKTDNGKIETLVKYIEISDSNENLSKKFEVVKKYIEDYYIGEIKTEKMNEAAVKGYVEGLEDEYTEYLTKDEYQELLVSVTGDYVGIGIYMYQDLEGNIVVIMPIEGSPAEAAELQTEDIILSINGESTQGMNINDASTKIKGQEGTVVELEIKRGENIISKSIERKKIEIPDTSSEVLKDNIGYIELITFDTESTENVLKHIQEFQKKGINSIIIDLRDNTGGVVTEAIKFSELFVEKDNIIMRSYNKTQDETIVKSTNKSPLDIEVVLLVNEYSASATEIVTAALKENNVATVVGSVTYGKGVMQEIVPLFEGALKITIEEFKTPEGNKINGEGVIPDIIIEDNVETEEDEQLQKAIELLTD